MCVCFCFWDSNTVWDLYLGFPFSLPSTEQHKDWRRERGRKRITTKHPRMQTADQGTLLMHLVSSMIENGIWHDRLLLHLSRFPPSTFLAIFFQVYLLSQGISLRRWLGSDAGLEKAQAVTEMVLVSFIRSDTHLTSLSHVPGADLPYMCFAFFSFSISLVSQLFLGWLLQILKTRET